MRVGWLQGRLAPWRILVAVLCTVVLLSAAACGKPSSGASSASASSSSEATPSAPASHLPGAAITSPDQISVQGGFGTDPKVSAAWPLHIDKTTSTVLAAGNGPIVSNSNQTIEVNYQAVNAANGNVFDDSWNSGKTAFLQLANTIPGFSAGLLGKRVGDRVLIIVNSADGYDPSGVPQVDIQPGDTLVFVVDIVSAPLPGPSGEPVTPAAGLPAVTDVDGQPKVTMPGGNPPASLVSQPLIKGTGRAVQASDIITVNYAAYNWADGRLIETTYGAQPQQGLLSKLIPGWSKGLVNQPVGSRVLLVVPPADAYPQGNATPSIAAGTTIVYVVDILYAAPSQ